jgi:hypothetical protein
MAENRIPQPSQEADPPNDPSIEPAGPEATQETTTQQAVQSPLTADSEIPQQTGLPSEPTNPASNPQNHAPLQIDEDVPNTVPLAILTNI